MTSEHKEPNNARSSENNNHTSKIFGMLFVVPKTCNRLSCKLYTMCFDLVSPISLTTRCKSMVEIVVLLLQQICTEFWL